MIWFKGMSWYPGPSNYAPFIKPWFEGLANVKTSSLIHMNQLKELIPYSPTVLTYSLLPTSSSIHIPYYQPHLPYIFLIFHTHSLSPTISSIHIPHLPYIFLIFHTYSSYPIHVPYYQPHLPYTLLIFHTYSTSSIHIPHLPYIFFIFHTSSLLPTSTSIHIPYYQPYLPYLCYNMACFCIISYIQISIGYYHCSTLHIVDLTHAH